jgi:hypothetical protein
MRLWKMSGLTVVALVVVAAAVMASVSSAAMTLPEFKTKANWTGSSKAGILLSSGVEIKCESGTNSGEMEANKHLGTFSILFTKCKSKLTSPETCTTSGSASGLIEVTGTWHLVLGQRSGVDKRFILFLVKPFTTECGTVKIETKGDVLGEITPVEKATKAYNIAVNAPSGVQEDTSFENDAGETVSAGLLAAAALGFHKATEESAENNITTNAVTEIVS